MSMRFEELKQLAMVEVRSHGAFGESERYKELDVDKFAELIIKECSKIADDCADRASWMAGYRIKQHFGVE